MGYYVLQKETKITSDTLNAAIEKNKTLPNI